MTNANRRRGVQVRVRSHLELLLIPTLWLKNTHLKMLSITIRGLVIEVDDPDGKETEGTDVFLYLLDKAVINGYQSSVSIGDPFAKACAFCNPPRSGNRAGHVLDTWL